MTDAPLDLYEPILTLKPVAEGIWIIDGPIVRMAMYGTGVPFPTRATVVRLASGGLWVHSPTIELPERLRAELAALGPVEHLVSANRIHYAGIPLWSQAWPTATCWASPGVRERAASQHVAIRFAADLGDAPPSAWVADLDQFIFRGSRYLEEVVFLHRASRTLVLADLIENFERDKVHGTIFRALLALSGAVDPDGKAPVDLRATFWRRKNLARASFARMRAWKPERVILSHGRWYDHDGTAELDRAFRWLD